MPVEVSIQEETPLNNNLPPISDIICTLHLDNETKSDTLAALGQPLLFSNVPHRFIGRQVRVELNAKDCLPLDTTLVLQQQISLPLRRDETVYGLVHFRLWGTTATEVHIAGRTVTPLEDGLIELLVPIEEQRTAYHVEVQGLTDTIYMPCGKDDVIEIR